MYSALIVEDELLVCRGLCLLVDWGALGFSVDGFCGDADTAQRELATGAYDLLLCDIHIPGMSGLDLIHWMRAKGIRTEVIVVSAYAQFEYAQRAMRDEALAYLLKPVDEALLEDALKRAKQALDFRAQAGRERAPAEPEKDVVSAVVMEMHNTYGKNATVESLAKRFYISSAHLNRLFRKRFGVSVKEYANQVRMSRAMYLLEHTDLLIYEIAKEVGFRDIDYFTRVFKERTGQTPCDYRKAKRPQLGE